MFTFTGEEKLPQDTPDCVLRHAHIFLSQRVPPLPQAPVEF